MYMHVHTCMFLDTHMYMHMLTTIQIFAQMYYTCKSYNNGVGVDPIYMESNSYVSRGEPVTVGITNLR